MSLLQAFSLGNNWITSWLLAFSIIFLPSCMQHAALFFTDRIFYVRMFFNSWYKFFSLTSKDKLSFKTGKILVAIMLLNVFSSSKLYINLILKDTKSTNHEKYNYLKSRDKYLLSTVVSHTSTRVYVYREKWLNEF